MSDTDLQAHFEAIRIREAQAREHNLDSGLTATMLNLQQFLDEEDVDEAIAYLENEVDIKTMASHLHTFPLKLREKAGLLCDIYIDLNKGNAREPLDMSALIENYLANEAEDNCVSPSPVP
jgi:hypothetical protein